MIPYSRQSINKKDLDNVKKVLLSDYLTQGPEVKKFEKDIQSYLKVNYALALNSATSALHVACLALDLRKDDWLWTVPNTFVASANCALYCGAKIDFVDIDYKTGLISIEKLIQKLEIASKLNKLPKILIPVHLAGASCDMEKIFELSLIYNFKIIEDASHCLGAEYKNEKVGKCNYSSITTFSFHPVKMITTGEGGAATTNDNLLAEKMTKLRTHGITKNEKLFEFAENKIAGPWVYEQQLLGYNYRITDIQASLGISQIKKLDQFLFDRRRIENIYKKELSEESISFLKTNNDVNSSVHLVIVLLNINNDVIYKKTFEDLRNNLIGVQLHYLPVHLHPFYIKLGFKKGDFPESERYAKNAISLPVYPGLRIEEQEYVVQKLKKSLKKYKK